MNTETGIVKTFTDAEMKRLDDRWKPVDQQNLSQRNQRLIRVGEVVLKPRSKCACGSGKRFKSCCMTRTR